jgi:hypothetical protein
VTRDLRAACRSATLPLCAALELSTVRNLLFDLCK